MWGDSLLISPVLRPQTETVLAYFPGGSYDSSSGRFTERWFEYYTGDEVEGGVGRAWVVDAPRDYIPLHIRGGSILPTQEPDVTTTASRLKPFGFIVAPDHTGNALGNLYWDDGDSINPQQFELISCQTTDRPASDEVHGITCDVQSNTFPDDMILRDLRVFGVRTAPENVEGFSLPNQPGNVQSFTWNRLTKQMHVVLENVSLKSAFEISW